MYDEIVNLGISLTKLNFTDVLVEEAMVCSRTGISLGADFFFEEPSDLVDRFDGDKHVDFWRSARSYANERQPAFTTYFANILAAEALTRSAREDAVQPGINRLLSLDENRPHGDIRFETGWINHALLTAYKRIGDEKKARSKAVAIMGSLAVSRAP
jgi:hypothetical protein